MTDQVIGTIKKVLNVPSENSTVIVNGTLVNEYDQWNEDYSLYLTPLILGCFVLFCLVCVIIHLSIWLVLKARKAIVHPASDRSSNSDSVEK